MSAPAVPLVEELRNPVAPIEACARALGLPYLVFLDSAGDSGTLGRFSFLAADPWAVVRSKDGRTEQRAARAWRPIGSDPLDQVRALLAPHAAEAVPDLPPFQGGAAGYLGYDWGAALERVPAPRFDDLGVPDVLLGLYDWVLAWDHATGRAWIVSTGVPEIGEHRGRRAAERLAALKRRLAADRPPSGGARPAHAAATGHAPSFPVTGLDGLTPPDLRSNFTRADYLAAVARVREYVHAGDIFQANLSQRFEARLGEHPFALYRRLRDLNPAPFAAYLDCGDFVVASASPERFLQVSARPRQRVEARPIKGTRPRGIGPEHDAALAQALSESAKDRAENVMIVDLLRNDLSRVCRPGTVGVPELFGLEHYATVHHLVSTVVGELAPTHDAVDLLRAAFPGGSITGAPKVRAMQIIAELEPTRRGVYCGSIGYLSVTGALDASIVIRTYLIRGDDVYFQAGGGIVADSDPDEEYLETVHKARGLLVPLAATPAPAIS